jgi:hypothetical protein
MQGSYAHGSQLPEGTGSDHQSGLRLGGVQPDGLVRLEHATRRITGGDQHG